VAAPPIYLHVQPAHAEHWETYCGQYNACGQRVYFVDDGWYESVYVTDYRKKHGNGNNKGHGNKGHDKQH
jgi:hypothetical protein